MDKETLLLFVCLTVVCVSGVHPMGERSAMLHRNLGGDKNPGSTNKYTKFDQLIIRKIIKIIATGYQLIKLQSVKCAKSIPGVCPFVS